MNKRIEVLQKRRGVAANDGNATMVTADRSRYALAILRVLHIVSAISLGACFAKSDEVAKPPSYHGRVKDLGPPPSLLGDKWTGPTGLVIEDFGDLKSHPKAAQTVAKDLAKLFQPIGVRKVADFTYRIPNEPWRQITLRVFIFDSSESCRSWWEKKYRHDGWEKYYKPVTAKGYQAVDSTEVPLKRAAAIGNVWMTCHALKANDDHVKILDACIEKVRNEAKPK